MLVQSHNKHFLPSKLEKKDYGTWQYEERVRYRSLFLSRARCCSTEPKDTAPVRDRCDLRQIVRETVVTARRICSLGLLVLRCRSGRIATVSGAQLC